MRRIIILYKCLGAFALLISSLPTHADTVGISDVQHPQAGGISTTFDLLPTTLEGRTVSSNSLDQNLFVSRQQVSPFPLLPGTLDSDRAGAHAILAGLTVDNPRFVGPVAFCTRVPEPTPSPAPEPGTLALLGSGLLTIALRQRWLR